MLSLFYYTIYDPISEGLANRNTGPTHIDARPETNLRLLYNGHIFTTAQ